MSAILVTGLANAEPSTDQLVIDGEKEIITRAKAAEGMPYDEVVSGWHYREAETRALEADSFQNPAMLAHEDGATIWNTVEGTAGKSCASCHGDAAESMKDVGASYPKWDAKSGKPMNVELQINKCRTEQMGAEAYEFNKGGQIPLTVYVKNQALGKTGRGRSDLRAKCRNGGIWARSPITPVLVSSTCPAPSAMRQMPAKYIRADYLSQGHDQRFSTVPSEVRIDFAA